MRTSIWCIVNATWSLKWVPFGSQILLVDILLPKAAFLSQGSSFGGLVIWGLWLRPNSGASAEIFLLEREWSWRYFSTPTQLLRTFFFVVVVFLLDLPPSPSPQVHKTAEAFRSGLPLQWDGLSLCHSVWRGEGIRAFSGLFLKYILSKWVIKVLMVTLLLACCLFFFFLTCCLNGTL